MSASDVSSHFPNFFDIMYSITWLWVVMSDEDVQVSP